ncbi:MAG: T9SS type A sorting domain-containing protein [Bacteroidales bacterium]
MMKHILPFLLGMLVLLQANVTVSQSLKILHEEDNNADVSDSTLSFTGNVEQNYGTIEAHFTVLNDGDQSIDVKVKKYYVNIVPGTANDFCWNGTCLSSSTMISPVAVTLAAGASADDFDTHYHCLGNEGTSTIRYTAFDINNPTDSVSLTINYTAEPTGIEDKSANIKVSEVYPNPAKENTAIDYDLPAGSELKVIMYDIIGKQIKDYTCYDKGTVNINLTSLPKGSYICRYIINGTITNTQKLIIR